MKLYKKRRRGLHFLCILVSMCLVLPIGATQITPGMDYKKFAEILNTTKCTSEIEDYHRGMYTVDYDTVTGDYIFTFQKLSYGTHKWFINEQEVTENPYRIRASEFYSIEIGEDKYDAYGYGSRFYPMSMNTDLHANDTQVWGYVTSAHGPESWDLYDLTSGEGISDGLDGSYHNNWSYSDLTLGHTYAFKGWSYGSSYHEYYVFTYTGDTTAPTITVSKNTTAWAKQVQCTYTATDSSGIQAIKVNNIEVAKPNGTYQISIPGVYKFQAVDTWGNSVTKVLEVTNIDKVSPSVSVTIR